MRQEFTRSAAWRRRKLQWVEEELSWYFAPQIRCVGGCQRAWSLASGDLHLCSYDSLGAEAHDDLIPLCVSCHTDLHMIMERDVRLRQMDLRDASFSALAMIQSTPKSLKRPS